MSCLGVISVVLPKEQHKYRATLKVRCQVIVRPMIISRKHLCWSGKWIQSEAMLIKLPAFATSLLAFFSWNLTTSEEQHFHSYLQATMHFHQIQKTQEWAQTFSLCCFSSFLPHGIDHFRQLDFRSLLKGNHAQSSSTNTQEWASCYPSEIQGGYQATLNIRHQISVRMIIKSGKVLIQ